MEAVHQATWDRQGQVQEKVHVTPRVLAAIAVESQKSVKTATGPRTVQNHPSSHKLTEKARNSSFTDKNVDTFGLLIGR